MRRASLLLATVAVALACSDPSTGDPDTGAVISDTGAVNDTGVGVDAATPSDAGRDMGGPDYRAAFVASLDGTTWNGRATRNETSGDIERGYEMHFVGGGAPMWGEIRNPYGPSRLRILRFMRIGASDCADALHCDVSTTIPIPDTTWETPGALRNRMETWSFTITEAATRTLTIRSSAGVIETFDEGAWPVPTSGLTAEVRVFEGGSGNPIGDAFCSSGAIFSSDINRRAIWDFARGLSTEPTLGRDVGAGIALGEWNDVSNRFGIRDLAGFRIGDLGGSDRTDQFYFTVRYRGILTHPGGTLEMREEDDEVEDAVWAFVDDGVGGTAISDLFLEVHHFIPPDETPDEPSVSLAAGDVPIEIIVPRCEMDFQASGQVRIEMALAAGPWGLLRDRPIRPLIDSTLFPPVL